jgi:hypothetical protein
MAEELLDPLCLGNREGFLRQDCMGGRVNGQQRENQGVVRDMIDSSCEGS